MESNKLDPKRSERWFVASLNSLSPEERRVGKGTRYPDPFFFAELFHENSKFHPDLMSYQMPKTSYSKPSYKGPDGAPFLEIPPISELPPLDGKLQDALQARRSSWDFGGPIALTDLMVLLQHAFGVTGGRMLDLPDGKQFQLKFRSYPSGGALYPIHIYLYVNQVIGLEKGLYVFSPYESRLYALEKGGEEFERGIDALLPTTDPNRNPLFAAADFRQAAVFFFLAADFKHQSDKYGLRAYRLTLLEAGHAAQNLLLVSTALHMTGVPLAGFYDDRANRLLHLDGVEKALIYLLPIGASKEGE